MTVYSVYFFTVDSYLLEERFHTLMEQSIEALENRRRRSESGWNWTTPTMPFDPLRLCVQ